MNGLLQPAIRLGHRLSFRAKFLLWSALMLIPLLYGMGSLVLRLQHDVQVARSEASGSQLLAPLPQIESALLQQRRLLSLQFHEQKPDGLAAQITTNAQQITQLLSQWHQQLQQAGERQAVGAVGQLDQDWQQANKAENSNVTDVTRRYDQLLTTVHALYKRYAAERGLVQDPDISGYYMVQLTTDRLPYLRDLLGQLRDRGALVADFGLFQAQDYAGMRFRLDLLQAGVHALQTDLGLLYELDSTARGALQSQTQAVFSQIGAASQLIEDKMMKDQNVQLTPEQLLTQGDALDKQLQQLQAEAWQRLDQGLKLREQASLMEFYGVLGVVGGLLLVYGYLMLGAYLALQQTVHAVRAVAARVNTQDLSQSIPVVGQDELAAISRDYNQTLQTLRGLMEQVRQTAMQVVTQAETIADRTGSAEQAIAGQQGETHQVAAAVRQLGATSLDMASHAVLASDMTRATQQSVDSGERVIGRTLGALDSIHHSVENTASQVTRLVEQCANIGGVVDVIQGVAEQTNLLALNAAIEAARAGELGRGFAVVADEVRSLAARTRNSTTEIQRMIEQLQGDAQGASSAMAAVASQTQEGAGLAQSVKQALVEITGQVTRMVDTNTVMASAIEEQTAVVSDIERNIELISAGSDETLQVALAAREAAVTIHDQTMSLRQMVQGFTL